MNICDIMTLKYLRGHVKDPLKEDRSVEDSDVTVALLHKQSFHTRHTVCLMSYIVPVISTYTREYIMLGTGYSKEYYIGVSTIHTWGGVLYCVLGTLFIIVVCVLYAQ